MKKSLTRSLSLLLVLVMLVGLVPMALAAEEPVPTAAGSVSLSGSSELTLADGTATTTLTANATAPTDCTITSYTWSGVAGSPTGETADFLATSAGDYTVKVTVSFSDGTSAKAEKTIKVNPEPAELTEVKINGVSKVQVGKTITLNYSTEPADYKAASVKWESLSTDVATVSDGKVTGVAEGSTTIRLTVDGMTVDHDVTVEEAKASFSVDEEIILKKSATKKITVTFDPEDADYEDIEFDSDDISIATVNSNGVVTGKKAGTTTVTVTVLGLDGYEHDVTETVKVTVTDGEVECDVETEELDSTSDSGTITLNPEFDYDGEVVFTYEKSSSRGTISIDNDGVVTAKGPAAIIVKITAKDKETGTVLGTGTGKASFYVSDSVEVTMPDDNTTLTFSKNADIEESGNLLSKVLSKLDKDGSNGYHVYFSNLDAVEGSLAGTGWISGERRTTVGSLGSLTFTVGTKGKAAFNYTVVYSGDSDLPLLKGDIEIEYDGKLGYIEYSASYNSTLTFGENNFEKFWDACDMDGDLDYVKINALPTNGKLYTSKTSKTTTYAASTSHEFFFEYTDKDSKNNKNAKDLDLLTYVPLSTKKDTYDVLIPFTAYGEDKDESVTGNLLIHMNEAANDITSRGVFFGTEYDSKKDLTYADQIAEDYDDQMGEDLGYVIFTLPDAEKAHLYLEIPTSGSNTLVAQGTHLSAKDKLYYDSNDRKVYDLEDAAIIPAAGFSGKITLSYEAYDKDGKNKMEGTIVFNVTAKTKSAVFSDVNTTYSWAADSVDFLYYEGTAQGANNKYNPKNNITRGDFMLMLYRAFLAEDYGTYNVTSNFPDVVKGTSDYSKETYQAVGVAKYLGIAQGSNNKFNPKSSITREEAMALIQRTLEKTKRELDYSTSIKASSFSDYSSISTWARDAISELVAHGVIVGSNNKVNPKSNITRAEMACILHRVITY